MGRAQPGCVLRSCFSPSNGPGDRNGSFPGGSFLSGQRPKRGMAWRVQPGVSEGTQPRARDRTCCGEVTCPLKPSPTESTQSVSQSVSQPSQTTKMCTKPPAAGHHPGMGIPSEQMQRPQRLQEERGAGKGAIHQEMPSKHLMTVDNEYSETEKLAGHSLHSFMHIRGCMVGRGQALQPHEKLPSQGPER